MRIVQLSDSHLSRNKPARAAELEASIKSINALQPMPDAVVHTGDIAHDGKTEDYITARRLLDGLSAPYFVLAGNHDNRRNLLQVFADGRHLRSDMTFVQYAVEDFDVRLIMIDTVSTLGSKGQLCAARLKHIGEMMAADPTRPIALFLHHPPFRVDVGPKPYDFEEWSEAKALIAKYQRQKNGRGLYSGHVHRTFETSIGAWPACVVSSTASDRRWDAPHGPNQDLPVYKIRIISAEV